MITPSWTDPIKQGQHVYYDTATYWNLDGASLPRSMDGVQSFMDKERFASFSTVNPKCEPHAVPVFFTYEESKVYVQTDRRSVKSSESFKKIMQ